MSKPLRVRRLTDQEGRELQRIVRRGSGSSDGSVVKWRRALVVLASADGNTVPAIARLAATSQDRVREMIRRFNELGMASLDPQWAGGRPRRVTTDDEDLIVETATTRPEALELPFTRWSLRKLAAHLREGAERPVRVSPERLRQILRAHDVTFQRTRTWKESNDPEREAKLARIEEVVERCPQRCFAFDEFGPLQIRPVAGSGWSRKGRPQRLRANYNKLHGVRQFHGCYSLGEDTLWGTVRRQKSAANTLAALKSIRARRRDGEPIYIILDNLSAHKHKTIRDWASDNSVELCYTPTYSSWAALGPTPSRRTSGHCGSSCSTTPTTPTTPCSPAGCTHTCDGATPTPATPTCSPRNAENAPAPEPNETAAGASQPQKQHEPVTNPARAQTSVDSPLAGRRPAALDQTLAVALAAHTAAGFASRALAPGMLVVAPLLLAIMDARFTTQVLLVGRLGPPRFVIAAAVGMALSDPIAFYLGRLHGRKLLERGRRWFPVSTRLVAWSESIMVKSRGLPIVLFGGVVPCAVAGAAGVSWTAFAISDSIGIAYRMVVVVMLSSMFSEQVDWGNRLVGDYTLALTAATILMVLVDLAFGRMRARHRSPDQTAHPHDAEV